MLAVFHWRGVRLSPRRIREKHKYLVYPTVLLAFSHYLTFYSLQAMNKTQASKQQNNGFSLSSTSITNKKHSHPARPKSPTPSDLSTSTTLVNLPKMTQRSASPVQLSPRSSFSSLSRSDSHSRKHTRKTSNDYRRYNGTVNHYGRHSNDWLFGGFSLRDTVRGGVERLRHHSHHGNEG